MTSSSENSAPTAAAATVPIGTQITLSSLPDDFHHHFRDGPATAHVLEHVVQQFGRAIVMPNLKPPITTTQMALEYRERILASLSSSTSTSTDSPRDNTSFEPLMTLYLTDHTTPEEIYKAHATNVIYACKYYPAGATTNSDEGVTDITKLYPTLHAMADVGMVLCIHSEVSSPSSIDIFDREKEFLHSVLIPLVSDMPSTLKIVMEHISTLEAVEYITHTAPPNVSATITAHHLLYNRNALLVSGIKPHFYCLPILKREDHRLALLKAATSGSPKFFLGTDSAPHAIEAKESACGCAGIYTAHAAIQLYAEAFESVGALEKLEGFACHYGADFYGLPRKNECSTTSSSSGRKTTMVLEKKSWKTPEKYKFGTAMVRPLRAGEEIAWSIVS